MSVQPDARRDDPTESNPLTIALESNAKHVVVDAEITVGADYNSSRRHDLHFLRDHTYVGLLTAIIAEPVEADPIVKMTEQLDVVLQVKVGTSTTSAAPSTAAPTATKSAAATTAESAASLKTAAAATVAKTSVAARALCERIPSTAADP